MIADEAEVFEPEFFGVGLGAVVALVEFLHRIELLVGMQERAAFEAEGFGNGEDFVADALVDAEEVVEFVGREEVPEDDAAPVAALFGQLGMRGDDLRFGGGGQLALEVAGGVGEFGEEEHLSPGERLVGFEELDERLELVVALGFHVADELEESGELVQVVVGVVEHLVHFELGGGDDFDGLDFLRGDKILGLLVFGIAGEKLGLMLAHVADEFAVA